MPANDQVVCTLYEGDFHFGVAAMINSIVRGGFKGLFWVGNRGGLPPWTEQLKRRPDGLFEVGEALLGFESIDISRHFGQFKPEFMRRTIDKGIARRFLWYFDPDITIRCEWSFFERWIRFGVCLCQELTMANMAPNHPLRCEWLDLARSAGWGEPHHLQDRYYNSGFLGMNIERHNFLNTWRAAVLLANAAGVEQDQFQQGTRAQTFYTVDQDAMNIAAMYSDECLSTMGPEGMGWIPGGFIMHHTVGYLKPWRKKFLRSALMGDPPGHGDKHFFQCVEGPIYPFTPAKLSAMQFSVRCGAFLGRFIRRT